MKVGKNNFRPPPQVESSVVRIEPKMGKDRPNVSWDEWDGLLRVCFVRKNKTLRASWLGTREVLVMIEKNYRTWCALNGVPVDETEVDDSRAADIDMEDGMAISEEAGDGMDVDGNDAPDFFKELSNSAAAIPNTKSKRKKTKVADLVREKIRKVLEDVTALADKRSAKCDENDFLRLLFAFNEEGIHFS